MLSSGMVGHKAGKVHCFAIVETTEARVERPSNDQESHCVLQQYTVFHIWRKKKKRDELLFLKHQLYSQQCNETRAILHVKRTNIQIYKYSVPVSCKSQDSKLIHIKHGNTFKAYGTQNVCFWNKRISKSLYSLY